MTATTERPGVASLRLDLAAAEKYVRYFTDRFHCDALAEAWQRRAERLREQIEAAREATS